MSLHTEAGLNTGTYTCRRANEGSLVKGRIVRVATTDIPFTAGIQPTAGRKDDDQPEGQTTTESITVYTDFQLLVTRQGATVGVEADLIIISSGPFAGTWVVTSVKYHGVISGHYVATADRLYVGEVA